MSKEIKRAAIDLIESIQAAGGLIAFPNGLYAPVGSPEWIDIGHDVKALHKSLCDDGTEIALTITEEEDL